MPRSGGRRPVTVALSVTGVVSSASAVAVLVRTPRTTDRAVDALEGRADRQARRDHAAGGAEIDQVVGQGHPGQLERAEVGDRDPVPDGRPLPRRQARDERPRLAERDGLGDADGGGARTGHPGRTAARCARPAGGARPTGARGRPDEIGIDDRRRDASRPRPSGRSGWTIRAASSRHTNSQVASLTSGEQLPVVRANRNVRVVKSVRTGAALEQQRRRVRVHHERVVSVAAVGDQRRRSARAQPATDGRDGPGSRPGRGPRARGCRRSGGCRASSRRPGRTGSGRLPRRRRAPSGARAVDRERVVAAETEDEGTAAGVVDAAVVVDSLDLLGPDGRVRRPGRSPWRRRVSSWSSAMNAESCDANGDPRHAGRPADRGDVADRGRLAEQEEVGALVGPGNGQRVDPGRAVSRTLTT